MALSLYTHWESSADYTTPGGDFFDSSDVADALRGFLDPVEFPLFPLDDIFATALDIDLSHCCAKRQRCCPDCQPPPLGPPPTFEPGPCPRAIVCPPPPPLSLPNPRMEGGSGGLSAQSVAARERRKRISEKTQELGRLVPGGAKMNTAEMLQAAHKYVRYLQAQIAIFGLMINSQKINNEEGDELLQVMMVSGGVQERLSKEGMCLVPNEIVEDLAANRLLKSTPFMEREMNKFFELISDKSDNSK